MPTVQTSPDGSDTPEHGIPQVRPGDASPPYQEVTDVAFGDAAARTFEIEQPDRHTLLLRGHCPRCHHTMDFMISDQVVRRQNWFTFRGAGTASKMELFEEPMMCTCGIDHPRRPTDTVGCGAYWNLEIRRS
jgi:hypothetical protein